MQIRPKENKEIPNPQTSKLDDLHHTAHSRLPKGFGPNLEDHIKRMGQDYSKMMLQTTPVQSITLMNRSGIAGPGEEVKGSKDSDVGTDGAALVLLGDKRGLSNLTTEVARVKQKIGDLGRPIIGGAHKFLNSDAGKWAMGALALVMVDLLFTGGMATGVGLAMTALGAPRNGKDYERLVREYDENLEALRSSKKSSEIVLKLENLFQTRRMAERRGDEGFLKVHHPMEEIELKELLEKWGDQGLLTAEIMSQVRQVDSKFSFETEVWDKIGEKETTILIQSTFNSLPDGLAKQITPDQIRTLTALEWTSSKEIWKEFVEILEMKELSDEAKQKLVDFAQGCLGHWPDELREGNQWYERQIEHGHVVGWELVRGLDFSIRRLSLEAIQPLANFPYGGRLTVLNLRSNGIGAEGAQALAASQNFPALASLGLWGNNMGTEGVQALAASQNFPALTSLDLGFNNMREEGFHVLAASQNFPALTSLDLGFNYMQPEGAQALAASQNFPALTSLDLRGNIMGVEGAQALAASQNFPALTSLDLRGNYIRPEGAQALAASQNFPALTSLDLGDTDIGTEGAQALAASQNFPALTSLDLVDNRIGDEGFQTLDTSPRLQNCTIFTDQGTLEPNRHPVTEDSATNNPTTMHLHGFLLATLAMTSFMPSAEHDLWLGGATLVLLGGKEGLSKLKEWWQVRKEPGEITAKSSEKVLKLENLSQTHGSPDLIKLKEIYPLEEKMPLQGYQEAPSLTQRDFSRALLEIELESLQVLRENAQTLPYVEDLEKLIKDARHQGDFETATEEIVHRLLEQKKISNQVREALTQFGRRTDERIKNTRKEAKELRSKLR